jgi:hypothetical protein
VGAAGEYHRFKDLAQKIWQYHFEFLNLGYAAYLDFFGFCKQAFPSIPDLAIAKMVAGIEVDLFRPNEELKNLAKQGRSTWGSSQRSTTTIPPGAGGTGRAPKDASGKRPGTR